MNATEPSPIAAFTPSLCRLRAEAQMLADPCSSLHGISRKSPVASIPVPQAGIRSARSRSTVPRKSGPLPLEFGGNLPVNAHRAHAGDHPHAAPVVVALADAVVDDPPVSVTSSHVRISLNRTVLDMPSVTFAGGVPLPIRAPIGYFWIRTMPKMPAYCGSGFLGYVDSPGTALMHRVAAETGHVIAFAQMPQPRPLIAIVAVVVGNCQERFLNWDNASWR